MWGVVSFGLPCTPRSPYPWSSLTIKRMLGDCAWATAGCSAACPSAVSRRMALAAPAVIAAGKRVTVMSSGLSESTGHCSCWRTRYDTVENLPAVLDSAVIGPAIELEQKLLERKA